MKIKLIKASKCARDEHEELYYERPGLKVKPELPQGTILEVEKEWSNAYGSYYLCQTENGSYSIPKENAKLI